MPAPEHQRLRLSYWLGTTLRAEREAAGYRRKDIVGLVDAEDDTVRRFERGDGFSTNPDQLVAAYALTLSVEDPRSLWELAIERWRKAEGPPDLRQILPATPGLEWLWRAREERLRLGRIRSEPSEKPPSNGTLPESD